MHKDHHGIWLDFREEFPGQGTELGNGRSLLQGHIASQLRDGVKKVSRVTWIYSLPPAFLPYRWCSKFPQTGTLSGLYNEYSNSCLRKVEKRKERKLVKHRMPPTTWKPRQAFTGVRHVDLSTKALCSWLFRSTYRLGEVDKVAG